MPDTPDDPLVELVPEQRDDDTEAESERRAAQARAEADKLPTHDLAEEAAKLRDEEDEQARFDEADDAARAERVELAAKDELERLELRDRNGLDATAETIRALELAHVDEEASRRYRERATTEVQHSVGDLARGRHKLDEAEAHPDERGAAGLAASGRRDERASGIEARRAESYDRRADGYEESAEDHRRDARQPEADANGAVQNPPLEAPEAQLPRARLLARGPRSRQKKKQQEQRRDTGIDLDM
ncbi:hypothetical protein [Kribbella kalugense]|uniref:Colicin import membrane protein n=1 Tax=Kribbella kalugense TaxID=2512221 RepID=A0A4R7ZJT0_9ACTN|nr:hypothetical protein [Kribbella kalugense]TDW18029.1 hypothetical protein EV650_4610 [Kribbella kalugense]